MGLVRRNNAIFVAIAAVLALAALAPVGAPDAGSGLNRIIVIEHAPSSDAAEQAVEAAGGRVDASLGLIGGFSARVPSARLAALAAAWGVRSVMPDTMFHTDAKPTGSAAQTPASTQTTAVDAPKVWSSGYMGSAATSDAVLDSGIAPVKDLVSPVNRIAGWKDFVSGSAAPIDPHGHGTYIAGIIAGNGTLSAGKWKGIAPETRLVGIRVFDALGTATASRVIQGIQWAIQSKAAYGIRVLNLSFSTDSAISYRFDAVADAAEQAWKEEIAQRPIATGMADLSRVSMPRKMLPLRY